LIEGDLRRPRVADYLELERSVGLSNVLIGRATFADAVQDWGPHGLQVLTGGVAPPNPSELLGSPAMSELLAQFHQDYDLVIIDSPPLGPVTDASILGAQADGVLIVFRYGKTKRAQLARTVHALDVVGARKLGAVMNLKPIKRSERAYYGRYQEHDATAVGTAFPEQAGDSSARHSTTDEPARERAQH
jgi:capsular exopolysaccharide synthesis family protein